MHTFVKQIFQKYRCEEMVMLLRGALKITEVGKYFINILAVSMVCLVASNLAYSQSNKPAPKNAQKETRQIFVEKNLLSLDMSITSDQQKETSRTGLSVSNSLSSPTGSFGLNGMQNKIEFNDIKIDDGESYLIVDYVGMKALETVSGKSIFLTDGIGKKINGYQSNVLGEWVKLEEYSEIYFREKPNVGRLLFVLKNASRESAQLSFAGANFKICNYVVGLKCQ